MLALEKWRAPKNPAITASSLPNLSCLCQRTMISSHVLMTDSAIYVLNERGCTDKLPLIKTTDGTSYNFVLLKVSWLE